mmetsp:Transcript_10043/g.15011  ORF Transcript_10043/g.15011 Transcript_10043/m.15011 type:complete len:166 (+) Transcript_10043:31-528(+)
MGATEVQLNQNFNPEYNLPTISKSSKSINAKWDLPNYRRSKFRKPSKALVQIENTIQKISQKINKIKDFKSSFSEVESIESCTTSSPSPLPNKSTSYFVHSSPKPTKRYPSRFMLTTDIKSMTQKKDFIPFSLKEPTQDQLLLRAETKLPKLKVSHSELFITKCT